MTASPAQHRVVCLFEDGACVPIQAREAETVYQAALRQGLPILVDCKEGGCGTCKATCPSGSYWLGDVSDEALTPEEEAGRRVLACQMHVTADAVVEFPYPLSATAVRPTPPLDTRVTAVERASATVVRLLLEPAGGRLPDFLPGQYVNLSVPGTGETRSYSFANPPGSGPAEFFIRLLPDGAMSRYLTERARPGDAMTLGGPLGRFFLRPPRGPVVMVAGGTGLAPMLSMLDSMAGQGAGEGTPPERVSVLYGVNAEAELFGLERLAALGDRLDVRTAVLHPGPDWSGPTGHVTALLDPALLAGGEADVYLCGPPPMIEAAESWLRGQGHPETRIHAEKFLPSR